MIWAYSTTETALSVAGNLTVYMNVLTTDHELLAIGAASLN